MIDPKDLLDAHEVAELIGLSRGGNVSVYRKRYPDFPEPIVDKGRCMLWARSDVEAWSASRARPDRDLA